MRKLLSTFFAVTMASTSSLLVSSNLVSSTSIQKSALSLETRNKNLIGNINFLKTTPYLLINKNNINNLNYDSIMLKKGIIYLNSKINATPYSTNTTYKELETYLDSTLKTKFKNNNLKLQTIDTSKYNDKLKVGNNKIDFKLISGSLSQKIVLTVTNVKKNSTNYWLWTALGAAIATGIGSIYLIVEAIHNEIDFNQVVTRIQNNPIVLWGQIYDKILLTTIIKGIQANMDNFNSLIRLTLGPWSADTINLHYGTNKVQVKLILGFHTWVGFTKIQIKL